MKTALSNTVVLKNLHHLYSSILNLKTFSIQRSRLIFKPEKNTIVHISNVGDMSVDHEKYHHRPNTRPMVEKQTLRKEKRRKKNSD